MTTNRPHNFPISFLDRGFCLEALVLVGIIVFYHVERNIDLPTVAQKWPIRFGGVVLRWLGPDSDLGSSCMHPRLY